VSVAPIVAIDGAAGAGKSTLARGLARRLGLAYVNTGEMYRAVAAAALRAGVDADDADGLLHLAGALRFTLTAGRHPELEIEGWTPSELHTDDVEATVSAVARHPRVRDHLRGVQRALAADGAVVEGRDIAIVVAPDAPVKIFVTADPAVRAARRAAERGAARHDTVADAIERRDTRDAVTNPLRPAADAVVLDTTDLDVDAALVTAMAIVRERVPELAP
jgi:cytidylate kinase